MGMKKLFRRRGAGSHSDTADVPSAMRPWWAWGPLGLVWFGGHHTGSNIDAGHLPHHGDAGNFHNPGDHGGGFSGFDGGGGGGGF